MTLSRDLRHNPLHKIIRLFNTGHYTVNDIMQQDEEGYDVLYHSIMYFENTSMLEFFLDQLIKNNIPKEQFMIQYRSNFTLLQRCCIYGYPTAIHMLIDKKLLNREYIMIKSPVHNKTAIDFSLPNYDSIIITRLKHCLLNEYLDDIIQDIQSTII